MKALDILRWVSYMGESGEHFQVVNIDEDFDFESFFGYEFKTQEYGNYFCYYTDLIDYNEISAPTDNMNFHKSPAVEPSFSIDTGNENEYGEKVFIHFYKIED